MATILDQLAKDLVDKISTIPELQGRVGLSIGGRQSDPNMLKSPVPLAWVIFKSASATDDPQGRPPSRQSMSASFSVWVISDYENQSGMLSSNLPLVENCMRVVAGTNVSPGVAWFWEHSELVSIDTNRLTHRIDFCVKTHLQA